MYRIGLGSMTPSMIASGDTNNAVMVRWCGATLVICRAAKPAATSVTACPCQLHFDAGVAPQNLCRGQACAASSYNSIAAASNRALLSFDSGCTTVFTSLPTLDCQSLCLLQVLQVVCNC